jgi:nucleotide-binding universal stress UspA family protein
MKKIIAAFDGLKLSTGTMDYAIHIAKSYNAHLVGIFLDDYTYSGYGYGELLARAEEKNIMQLLDEADRLKRKAAADRFTTQCREAAINFSVHHDRKIAMKELLHESIYADLLIIDRKESFGNGEELQPTGFIHDLLADVHCPVLLVPGKFIPPVKNIILYDGSPSSVYAIKAFDYVMQPFKHLETEVVSVKATASSLHVPDNTLMKEFMKRHFPKAVFTVLKGSAEETIVTFLLQQKEEVMVILGAYQRNRVSRWFKPSMADMLVQQTKLPLFVAHY